MGTKEIFSTVAEAAEHLNAIIEYSFDGIFITDKNCNVLRINHSYEEITGLTKDEILGKNMADLVQQKLISGGIFTAADLSSARAMVQSDRL